MRFDVTGGDRAYGQNRNMGVLAKEVQGLHSLRPANQDQSVGNPVPLTRGPWLRTATPVFLQAPSNCSCLSHYEMLCSYGSTRREGHVSDVEPRPGCEKSVLGNDCSRKMRAGSPVVQIHR